MLGLRDRVAICGKGGGRQSVGTIVATFSAVPSKSSSKTKGQLIY
jgi:hypothetical protein